VLIEPFDERERVRVLERYWRALDAHEEAMEAGRYAVAKRHRLDVESARAEYFRRLPRVAMACSPFDGKPLVRSFDPFGLDGLWWRSPTAAVEPPPGPFFCVLRGAVHYRGLPPRAGRDEVSPGPEVPYVISRLLEHDGMVLVIGEVPMANGYVAYPLAYFARRRPPVQELAADWPGTEYLFTTAAGEQGWREDNDPWDFDLRPWLAAGKVRWCEPGSGNERLAEAPPDACPYLDLEGRRAPLEISDEKWVEKPLPSGKPSDPWD
jgi:hypothetical protein